MVGCALRPVPESEVLGAWVDADDRVVLVLNADGTFEITDMPAGAIENRSPDDDPSAGRLVQVSGTWAFENSPENQALVRSFGESGGFSDKDWVMFLSRSPTGRPTLEAWMGDPDAEPGYVIVHTN